MSPPRERPPTGTAQSEEWPETGASPWLLVEGSCAPGPRDPIPRHFPTLQAKLFNSPEGTICGAVPSGWLRALPSHPGHSQCLHPSLSSLPRGSPRAVSSARSTALPHTLLTRRLPGEGVKSLNPGHPSPLLQVTTDKQDRAIHCYSMVCRVFLAWEGKPHHVARLLSPVHRHLPRANAAFINT